MDMGRASGIEGNILEKENDMSVSTMIPFVITFHELNQYCFNATISPFSFG